MKINRLTILLILGCFVAVSYFLWNMNVSKSTPVKTKKKKKDNIITNSILNKMTSEPLCTSRLHSQFYDDFFLRCLLDVLNLSNKPLTFFEIGAHVKESNFLLFQKMKLALNKPYEVFRFDMTQSDEETRLFAANFKKENVLEIAEEYTKKIDILSIDIDSYDYYLLKEMRKAYKPKIIDLEINSCFNPLIPTCIPANIYLRKYSYGMTTSSIQAYINLLKDEYVLVHLVDTINAIFVHKDYVDPEFKENWMIDYELGRHCPAKGNILGHNGQKTLDKLQTKLGCDNGKEYFDCQDLEYFIFMNSGNNFKERGDFSNIFKSKCNSNPNSDYKLYFDELDNLNKNNLNL